LLLVAQSPASCVDPSEESITVEADRTADSNAWNHTIASENVDLRKSDTQEPGDLLGGEHGWQLVHLAPVL